MPCLCFCAATQKTQKQNFPLNCNAHNFQKTFCEGLEVKDSPVHYLDGNDVLLDYICYLSLRQWRREQIPKDQLPYLPCAPGDLD